MSTSNKLKAYVRFDGSGRVVPSSLILARFKPKVGNYQEIDAYECCNDVPTTTTTTTQGGETPTAWVGQIATTGSTTAWDACNGLGSSIIVYTNSATEPLAPGTALYSDASLTTLIPYVSGSISINEIVYEIVNGYINPLASGIPCIFVTTTTTTTAYVGSYYNVAYEPGLACGVLGFANLPLTFVPENACVGGEFTLAVGTWADYGIISGTTIYVNIGTGSVTQLVTTGSTGSSNLGCVSCG